MSFLIRDCEQKVIEIDAVEAIEVLLQHIEEKAKTKLPRSPNMNILINPQVQKILITVTTDVTGVSASVGALSH